MVTCRWNDRRKNFDYADFRVIWNKDIRQERKEAAQRAEESERQAYEERIKREQEEQMGMHEEELKRNEWEEKKNQ